VTWVEDIWLQKANSAEIYLFESS